MDATRSTGYFNGSCANALCHGLVHASDGNKHDKDGPMTVDHDFTTMMTPNHEGAIDMAKAELTYGKDP